MSADRQERHDRFYFERGPCCAGCDWWRSINSRVGECTKNAAESGADVLIAGMADEIERLRAVLLRAYKFVSPLSDPLPITNREMAAELMAALRSSNGKITCRHP